MIDDRTNRGRSEARPTLKTIAAISGLAVTTVSRALGDAPDISAETKKKVRGIAREIGYVPNRAGVRLRTGRTNVISLVLDIEDDVMNMTASLIGAISRGLSGTPYHLVMIPQPPGQDPLASIKYIVETHSADAIIINQIQPEDPRIAYLRARNFPFATHGRSVWAEEHAYFDFDNEAFGRIAVETLADRGCTKVLLLAPPTDQNYAVDMVKGATQAAAKTGLDLMLTDAVSSDSDRATLARETERVLRDVPDLDAIISATPNATMVAAAAVEASGRTIGIDFDIFSKETVPFLTLFRPGILTLQEDIEKAGLFLAKAAIDEVAGARTGHMQALDRPEFLAPNVRE